MNHDPLNSININSGISSTNSQMIEQQLFALNKLAFDPFNFNSFLQSNLNGQLELIASKDLLPNEEIICWFSDTYIKNIKSKHNRVKNI